MIQRLVESSAIPKLLLDVTERSLEEQVNHIADWLEATGGLNPAESRPNPKGIGAIDVNGPKACSLDTRGAAI
jgi:hypothetical protein